MEKNSPGILIKLDLDAARRGFEAREQLKARASEAGARLESPKETVDPYPQQEKGRFLDILV